MCGIAGIVQFNSSGGISSDTLKKMTAMLHHRGPDEAGIYLDDQVGLGHARLSIIDLSSGTQPIHNEDQTLWIVYNGEVFNYPELRKDLQKQGHEFYTTTDTEVILHLYEEKGSACLEDMNGQFALAIWDTKKNELFLARDRLGIRPLYYTVHEGRFIFASEIKAIFQAEGVPRQIDPGALDQIFTFWTTLSGRTIFKDIWELPPGHYLTINTGQITSQRYWNIPVYPRERQLNLSPGEIAEEIRALLLDAVRIRLRADVPVGAYLSGGLDSSGVTALVVKNFDNRVKTFGIRFEEPAFDEGKYQQQMVSFLKANHQEVSATNAAIGEAFSKVLWHCEKPILRTAPIPLFLLSQLVRDSGLKVVLTGEGADEVFGGYNIFREAKVRHCWARKPESPAMPALLGQLYAYVFDNPRSRQMMRSFFARGLKDWQNPFFSHLVRWENTQKIKTFFSDATRMAVKNHDPYESLRQELPKDFTRWNWFAKAQYLEMTLFLSNYLLSSQGDRVAMAHSVEIRLPYLDYRILEFMAWVPAKWKILGMNEKHILKKAYQPILPEEIRLRSKHPYRAPIQQSLLNGAASEYTRDMLSERCLRRTGLFDAAKVNRLVQKLSRNPQAGEFDNMALVGILSTQMIHHMFIDNFPREPGITIKPKLTVDHRSIAQGDKAVRDIPASVN